MLAFAKAIAAGAEYIETDVHASLDGVAVVCHDPDLTRVAGRDIRVAQLTFSELRRIDLGEGQSFSSLSEVLDTFPETRFNIDMKAAAAVEPATKSIRDLRATSRVLVTSFSETRRQAAVDALPGVATSASASRFAMALLTGKLRARFGTARALRGLVAVQVPERALGLRVTTPRMIERLHDAGVEVHIWTVNSPARMLELLDLGVDGIVTDRADLALDVVRKRQ
jgi:glycerophosphoryl diester phosphodiesterase